MLRCELTYNLFAILRIAEYGIKETVEFIFQFRITAKQNFVCIGLKTEAFSEITEIVGDATEYHIALHDVIARKFDVFASKVVFTFLQCKG